MEPIARVANAGIRLQGNPAQQRQDGLPLVAADKVPRGVGYKGGRHGQNRDPGKAIIAATNQRSHGEQNGGGGNGCTQLFPKNDEKEQRRAVAK